MKKFYAAIIIVVILLISGLPLLNAVLFPWHILDLGFDGNLIAPLYIDNVVGNLWHPFIEDNKISVFDIQNEKWVRFELESVGFQELDTKLEYLRICSSEYIVIIGIDNKLRSYDPINQRWEDIPELPNSRVSNFSGCTFSEYGLPIFFGEPEFFQENNSSWKIIEMPEIGEEELIIPYKRSDDKWILKYSGDLYHFDNKLLVWELEATIKQIRSVHGPHASIVSSDGYLWVAGSNGLFRFSLSNTQEYPEHILKFKQETDRDYIYYFEEGSNNIFWISTLFGGDLYYFQDEKLIDYQVPRLTSKIIWMRVDQSRQRIYLSTNLGLFYTEINLTP